MITLGVRIKIIIKENVDLWHKLYSDLFFSNIIKLFYME